MFPFRFIQSDKGFKPGRLPLSGVSHCLATVAFCHFRALPESLENCVNAAAPGARHV